MEIVYDYPNNLTKEELKDALLTKDLLNELDLKLLRYQYQMKNSTATATQLAKLMGYKKHTVHCS